MKSIIQLEDEMEIKECPYYKSKHYIKFGKYNGIQRYRCKNDKCLRTFSINKTIILEGNVQIIKTIFKENNKGVKGIKGTQRGKIAIMSALDNNNRAFSESMGSVPCNQKNIEKVIKDRITDDAQIDAYLDRGLMAAAKKHNKEKELMEVKNKNNNIILYYLKQLNWIHKFRGISTKHIKRYLTWFSIGFNYKN